MVVSELGGQGLGFRVQGTASGTPQENGDANSSTASTAFQSPVQSQTFGRLESIVNVTWTSALSFFCSGVAALTRFKVRHVRHFMGS